MSAADDLFRQLDRELWLVTSTHAGRDGGLIATSVVSASIVPEAPRVVVGLARQHATWELVEASGALLLQLLPADRIDLVERFGMHSSRELDKFDGVPLASSVGELPRLTAAIGWLSCSVEDRWETGDRTFYLARVDEATAPPAGATILTMQQFLATAPREWLPTLRQQLVEDAARDCVAIEKWRESRNQSG